MALHHKSECFVAQDGYTQIHCQCELANVSYEMLVVNQLAQVLGIKFQGE